MDKNELSAERLRSVTDRFHSAMDTVAKLATIAGWVAAVYFIMNGLTSIVQANPDAIQALAKVVESMRINDMLGWIGTAFCGGGWYYERKGKKRAYKKNSYLRTQLESSDPHHSTSGLDDNGHTPK